MKKQLFN